MSFSKLSILGFISTVVAHGTVSGIVADGIYYNGYSPSYQYINPAPITVGWQIPQDLGNGFISPSQFATPDVICHIAATNAQIAAPVKAGGVVELQWTPWPSSHQGPIIDYLANCHGPCETVDKTTLEWFKIDSIGLISATNKYWATDELIANNNSWLVTIPTKIATGNYVLRHEIIALHSAQSANGAQDYPFCINLAITSSGTDAPGGTPGEALMKSTDPGIIYDLYTAYTTYQIPGPALYTGAISMVQSLPAKPTASAAGIYTVGAVGAPASTKSVAPTSAPPKSSSTTSVAGPKSSTMTTVTVPKTTSAPPKTTSTTAKTTTSAAPPPSGTTVPKYGQCGGQGYVGSTVCAAGSTCVATNQYYSQCT